MSDTNTNTRTRERSAPGVTEAELDQNEAKLQRHIEGRSAEEAALDHAHDPELKTLDAAISDAQEALANETPIIQVTEVDPTQVVSIHRGTGGAYEVIDGERRRIDPAIEPQTTRIPLGASVPVVDEA